MDKMIDWILYTALFLSWSAFLLADEIVKPTVEPARLSDPVLLAIVGVLLAIVTGGFGLLQAVLLARIQRQGAAAAVSVSAVAEEAKISRKELASQTADVAKALEISTESANKQLTSIHTLVNANMGAQLKISAVALRRVADLTKHPDDAIAAETAERLLAEHVSKQAAVDAETKKKGGGNG